MCRSTSHAPSCARSLRPLTHYGQAKSARNKDDLNYCADGYRAQATRSTAMSHPNLYYYRPGAVPANARALDADLCVYGATAAGVAAAVAATRLGRTAVLIEHGGALGGMTAGGLSNTDSGNKRAIGGLAREFYRRCGAHYGVAEEWRFEPHIAGAVLAGLLAEAGVPLYTRQPL